MRKILLRLITICFAFMLVASVDNVSASGAASVAKSTSITSTIYKISNSKLTIGLPIRRIEFKAFKENLQPAEGATITIYQKDGKTRVTSGSITPGMKVKVLASDRKTSKVYTIYRMKMANWQDEAQAVTGSIADPEVIDLGNGTYRMYYCVEPEVPGNNHEIYSAISKDGKRWTQEKGTRRTESVFPDIIKLSDGTWRMYYAYAGGIRSCISKDGLEWEDEEGIRVDSANDLGLDFDNIGASTTIQLDNGIYVMVYRASLNEKYSPEVPNRYTQLLMWATSEDGINFKKKGIAIDGRNEEFLGCLDGPEFFKWEDGTIRLYFWSYLGDYSCIYKKGKFSKPELEYTKATEKDFLKEEMPFPSNPPGDPALIKIGDTVFMYFGYHTKGIYYVTENK